MLIFYLFQGTAQVRFMAATEAEVSWVVREKVSVKNSTGLNTAQVWKKMNSSTTDCQIWLRPCIP